MWSRRDGCEEGYSQLQLLREILYQNSVGYIGLDRQATIKRASISISHSSFLICCVPTSTCVRALKYWECAYSINRSTYRNFYQNQYSRSFRVPFWNSDVLPRVRRLPIMPPQLISYCAATSFISSHITSMTHDTSTPLATGATVVNWSSHNRLFPSLNDNHASHIESSCYLVL